MTCQKRPYASRGDAKRAAREMHSRFGDAKQRAYRCSQGCDAWHLTSSYTARDSRRIERRHDPLTHALPLLADEIAAMAAHEHARPVA